MSPKKSNYTKAPVVPEAIRDRYQAILDVLTGATTVSGAAARLHLARNHFQTLMHRGLAAMIEALEPKPGGRPSRPEREVALEAEVARLRRENAQLRQGVETTERLLEVAGDLIRGRVRARPPKSPTMTPATKEGDSDDPEEPEPPTMSVCPRSDRHRAALVTETGRVDIEPAAPVIADVGGLQARLPVGDEQVRSVLEKVQALRRLGLPVSIAAALGGASAPTLRRWGQRCRHGEPARSRPGPCPGYRGSAQAYETVRELVRSVRGHIGAEALRRSVPGSTRRGCLATKRDELTRLERDRKAGLERVDFPVVGVVRGFDAMHVVTLAGMRFLLVAADGAVPYRTAIAVAERYDSRSVLAAIERDIAANGAPLVYRLDRARVHQVPEVAKLLASHGVLVLHGPPRCPRYYGQLERQNREHRAWLRSLGLVSFDRLAAEAQMMRIAFNSLLPRATLGWRTASQLWDARPPLTVDRAAFREEVSDRTARIRRELDHRGKPADMAERFAIEATLFRRGLLRRKRGARC